MGSLEALQAYWSSPGPLEVLASHLALLGILALAYRQTSRPAARLRLLYSVYGVDLSLWVFLAASFLLCVALSDHVEYEITGIKLAVSLSVIGGLVTGTLAGSVLATSRTAREAHLTRLRHRHPRGLRSRDEPDRTRGPPDSPGHKRIQLESRL